MFPACDVSLRNVWPREKILQLAAEVEDSDVKGMLQAVTDEWNEGWFSVT